VTAFWEDNVILKVVSGSRAHGLSTPESDEDTRGVCVPPREVLLGLQEFEQHENPSGDHVVYSLAKFARLALQGNPNIIETLFTDERHLLVCTQHGQRLRDARDIFLSRRVGERFSGYAVDQLRRLERHYRWLTGPPPSKPEPESFGAVLIAGRHKFPSADAERNYRAAWKHWNHYETWRKSRNPKRGALEEAHGYDTKHAMHLCRLLKMGQEILAEGVVRVWRPDAEWLMGVRRGSMTYAELKVWAADQETRLNELVAGSPLPEEPDHAAAERLVMEIHEGFLFGRKI